MKQRTRSPEDLRAEALVLLALREAREPLEAPAVRTRLLVDHGLTVDLDRVRRALKALAGLRPAHRLERSFSVGPATWVARETRTWQP